MGIGNKIDDNIVRHELKDKMYNSCIRLMYGRVWDKTQDTIFMYVSERVRTSIVRSTMTEIWRLVKI